jgi:diguanylate cyclase (GGDEF)-like protein
MRLLERENQLKKETDSRKEAEELVHEVIDTTSNMIAVTTLNSPIFFNRSMLKFLNITSVEEFEMSYQNLDELFMKNPNMIQNVPMKGNWLDTMINIDQDNPITMQAIGTSSKRIYTIQLKRLQTKEERYLFSFSDVTDIEDERKYYEEMATHDNLTGIYNRFYFIDATKRELKASIRDKRNLSLFMIDIDHFKSINDTFGHDVGDIVLKEFVNVIKNRLRESDILARWGGEEFIVTLPSTTIEDATRLAESLRKSIQDTLFSEIEHLTCCIGVSKLNDNDTIDTMVKRADLGLYEAKESGRNCVKVVDEI